MKAVKEKKSAEKQKINSTHDSKPLQWVPGIKCGQFNLGKPFSDITLTSMGFKKADIPGTDWITYKSNEYQASIHIKNGIIVSIECFESLHFSGIDLIGQKKQKLPKILGCKPTQIEYPDGSVMLEVQRLGLTLWAKNDCVNMAMVEAKGKY
jgi:hypothetical protein